MAGIPRSIDSLSRGLVLLALLAAVFSLSSRALAVGGLEAAVPSVLTVRGDLADDKGDPINDVVSFKIDIYVNGSSVWRTLYKVSVVKGAFSIQLGDSGQSAIPLDPVSGVRLPQSAASLSQSMFFG